MKKVTIFEFLSELSSIVHIDYKYINKAKMTIINTNNNPDFKSLVNLWREGWYDEDPQSLVNELIKKLC